MSATPIAIVGIGVKCAAGESPNELWNSLAAARSFAAPITRAASPEGRPLLVAEANAFEPAEYFKPHQLRRLDRVHQFALAATADAVQACSSLPAADRVAIVAGVGFGAPGYLERQYDVLRAKGVHRVNPLTLAIAMPNSISSFVSIELGTRGPCLTLSTACASGADAIGEAMRLLREQRCDTAVVVGADALITPAGVALFHRLEAMTRSTEPATASRPFDRDRDGFLLAEGACALVLERLPDAIAEQREPVACLLGYGSTSDGHHVVAPEPTGRFAAEAIRRALDDAGVDRDVVGHVNAHGTSTPLNDLIEGRILRLVFGEDVPPVTAPKGTTGHLLGGSGTLEAAATALSLKHDTIPPTAGCRDVDPDIGVDVVIECPRRGAGKLAITNSFGFGGHNACLVLGKTDAVG